MRQPQAQALRDVEKALQIFENTRKIPTSVIEARYCVPFQLLLGLARIILIIITVIVEAKSESKEGNKKD